MVASASRKDGSQGVIHGEQVAQGNGSSLEERACVINTVEYYIWHETRTIFAEVGKGAGEAWLGSVAAELWRGLDGLGGAQSAWDVDR